MSAEIRKPTLALVVVSCLFVLSGATGLAYEVLWFKRFSQMWGGSSASMAAVVACFLFGLGLGARIFGRLADRSPHPLKLYALFELLIGLVALAVPLLIDLVFPLSSSLYSLLADKPLAFAIARFGVTFLVIGPPTVLMGATLPLLVRQFAAAGAGIGAATSWLYFANSLGAAAGAWLTGFFLLPELGILWTNALVAGMNGLIALVAWGLVGELGDARAQGAPAPAAVPDAPSDAIPRRLLGAAALTGLAGVALQMVWARQMTLIVGGSTYAFTAVLAVFIFGLALGSLAFRLMVSNERQLPWVIGVSALGIALSTLVGLELQLVLAQSAGSVAPLRADMGFNTLFCLAVSTVLEGPATFFMGLLFPALVQYSGAGRERAGRTVGRMYAWNTAGSIVGATTTAVLLFPTIGAYGAAVAMLALYGASVLLLFPLRGSASPKSPQVLALATLFVALVGGFALRPNESDRMRLNIGYCLYGSTVQQFLQGSDVLMLEEAPTSNVMVLSYDARKMVGSPVETLVNVRVNGKVDGSNGNDMNTQLGTAYLPRFLRPGASDVLVIGFGTGTTAGASLQFPDTRVDCCEIEAAMVRASKFFHDYNHRPELSPNFRAIVEDGRNYIQGTDRTYDLVISEPSNPWIAGVGNLYTVEFYRAVREHLKSGGMLAQWIQAYSLSRTELALVIHTLQGVFEHVGLLRIDDMDLMLVASPAPIVPPSATLDEAQRLVDRSEPIRTALAERFATSDVRALLLWHYVLGNEGVQRIVDAEGQEGINTDNNLRLEFDAPRQLFSADALGHVGVIESVMHAVDAEHFSGLIARWGWTGEQLGALRRLRAHFVKVEHLAMMVAMSELGLAYASESDAPELLADSLLYHPPDDIGEFRIGVRHLVNDSPYEAQRVAAGLGQRGDPVRAAVAYEELLAKMPNSATVYASLAVCYDQLGRVDEVLQMLQRASELDPLNQSTRVVMENFDVELAERRAAEARAEAD